MYAITEAYGFHLGSGCEVARPLKVVISYSEHMNTILYHSSQFRLTSPQNRNSYKGS